MKAIADEVDELAMPPMIVHLKPAVTLTDRQFDELCRVNRDLRIERASNGDIIVMPPAWSDSGARNMDLASQLGGWAKRDGTGIAFDSSAGFTLPDKAIRSPDASWIRKSRLKGLTRSQRQKFWRICPDFVAELRSASDRLSTLQEKMEEYIDNGAQLGWLIDPQDRRVYVYRPKIGAETLEGVVSVSGDPELPGFTLDLRGIWVPDFGD